MSDLCEIEKKMKPVARYAFTGLIGFIGLSALYRFFFDGFCPVDIGVGIVLVGYSVICWKS